MKGKKKINLLFSCLSTLTLVFLLSKKAQVEAKKEHEGAVQLLEVSEPAQLAFLLGGE